MPKPQIPLSRITAARTLQVGSRRAAGCSEQHRAWLQVSSTTIFVLSPFSVVLCLCESVFKPSIPNLKRFCIISVVLELGQSSINLLRAWGPADVARGVRKLLSCAEGYGPTPEPVGEWGELPASASLRAWQRKTATKKCEDTSTAHRTDISAATLPTCLAPLQEGSWI